MKHTRQDLNIMHGWSLEKKIKVSQMKILEWYREYNGQVFTSFSGGKDSTVLLDLARQVCPDIPAVYVDTGLEYPELRDFVKTKDNVIWLRPRYPFTQIIEKYGYPVISKEVSDAVSGARKGQPYRLARLNGELLDKNGKMPKMKEALLADAVGTVTGSAMGTSTVTTFVESASGVEAGGRTGLTALTTGIMFLACIFLAPIAGIIPAAATSSALIYVGVLMVTGLKNVHFDDLSESVPVALMLIAMPVSGSIGHAIGIGLISYTVLKLFTGKAKDVSVLTFVLSVIFLLKFFLVA